MEELEEKTWMLMILKFLIILLTMINYVSSIESPEYRVILQYLESDVEIRLYEESFWVSAAVRNATSFEKSTKDGFHRSPSSLQSSHLEFKCSGHWPRFFLSFLSMPSISIRFTSIVHL